MWNAKQPESQENPNKPKDNKDPRVGRLCLILV